MGIKIELGKECDLLQLQNNFACVKALEEFKQSTLSNERILEDSKSFLLVRNKDKKEFFEIDDSILDGYVFDLQECANDYENIKKIVYDVKILALVESDKMVKTILKKPKIKRKNISFKDIGKLTVSFVFGGNELKAVYRIYYKNRLYNEITQTIDRR